MESRDEVAQVDVDDFGCPTSCSTCWRALFDGCRRPENDEETDSGPMIYVYWEFHLFAFCLAAQEAKRPTNNMLLRVIIYYLLFIISY